MSRPSLTPLAVGVLALAAGTLLYSFRPPTLLTGLLGLESSGAVLPAWAGSLPSGLHAFALALVTAALLRARRRAALGAVLAWGLGSALELIQHPALAPALAPLWSPAPWRAYARLGTFDPLDLLAVALGAGLALTVTAALRPSPGRANRRDRRGAVLPTLALAVGVLGSVATSPDPNGPYVELDLAPQMVCPGSELLLRWRSVGREDGEAPGVLLSAAPPTAVDPPLAALELPPSGSLVVTVSADVSFMIVPAVEDSAPYTAWREPVVIGAEGVDVDLYAYGGCVASGPVWDPLVVAENEWDPKAAVGRTTHPPVASDAPAMGIGSLLVTHGGATAEIAPGASSEALAGLPVAGVWEIEPLEPLDEAVCRARAPGAVDDAVPVLHIRVNATCPDAP